jgi:hypothetical protein
MTSPLRGTSITQKRVFRFFCGRRVLWCKTNQKIVVRSFFLVLVMLHAYALVVTSDSSSCGRRIDGSEIHWPHSRRAVGNERARLDVVVRSAGRLRILPSSSANESAMSVSTVYATWIPSRSTNGARTESTPITSRTGPMRAGVEEALCSARPVGEADARFDVFFARELGSP